MIGFEVEFVLKDKRYRVIRDLDVIDSLRYRIMSKVPNACVSTEASARSVPPRLEIKPCKPVRSVDEAVSLYNNVLKALRDMGFKPRIKGGKHSGSIHVTLDLWDDSLPSLPLFMDNVRRLEALYVASTGNPGRNWIGSKRVGGYPTVSPVMFFYPDETIVSYVDSDGDAYALPPDAVVLGASYIGTDVDEAIEIAKSHNSPFVPLDVVDKARHSGELEHE